MFAEAAHGPAHTLGATVHDARCDQGVQRRQVRSRELGHHGSEVLRHVILGRSPLTAVCDPVGPGSPDRGRLRIGRYRVMYDVTAESVSVWHLGRGWTGS